MILTKLSEGCTLREAAANLGISRVAVWYWRKAFPEFDRAYWMVRETGKDERTFRLWLRHLLRGMRPSTGKGHGGIPRFSNGRR